ncbi:rod shape-determining protein MreC [Oceanihabitans sp. 2_MG-2023]|uniref:rod shape-determining protein MreC n=1 Tax=Oceanihabitans sp. 2_MG-2023 TaxID=3062661 RepID=UPI0026E1C818|nr:rod shape-determining protein MreC [Oceanihabitans sp. 2_MG-2023]MDO6596178.1 rod shape-determining protein MreC [Oceanihabitans sp. 2_MG-2023]
MQQIINFILRNKSFLLYILLFFISIVFTIQNHSYQKSKFVNSANFLSGGIYTKANNISQYFGLKEQNNLLQEENNQLKSALYNLEGKTKTSFLDSLSFTSIYNFTPAIVIKNNYTLSTNILLIDKGKRDSIKQDFGVITSKGILGIIDKTSTKYATVLSILNTKSKISAQLKRTNDFGTLKWNGKTPELVQLVDIPSKAKPIQGDTIITSGRSAIFPKGIPIGIVKDFKLDAAEDFYEINVALFNDMTTIEHVYVIENKDTKEINNLLNPADE